jgi:uncharacterized OB-fold protein
MSDPLAPLLEGYAEDRLRLPVCEACGAAHLYPRSRCPRCGGARMEWKEASGIGRLASFSVVHRAPAPEFAADVPYAVATVRLEEGPQIMARIVEVPHDRLRIGMPLRLRFATMPGGKRRPVFAAAEAQDE